MKIDSIQRAHDAEMEASAWKETAMRWRKKVRAAEMATRIAEKEANALEAERDEAVKRLGQVGSLELRLGKAQQDLATERVRAVDARKDADRFRLQLRDANEAAEAEKNKPAAYRARMKVFAVRLGIDQCWKGWDDEEKLAAEIDRRLFELQQKANAKES